MLLFSGCPKATSSADTMDQGLISMPEAGGGKRREAIQGQRRRLRGLGWTIDLTPSPSLGKGWPQGFLNHRDRSLTSESEGRRLTPLWQPRQAQHAPLSERFHPPTPSRKAPCKIPANAANREGQSFACNRVPAKFSQVEGEQLFRNCLFFFSLKCTSKHRQVREPASR